MLFQFFLWDKSILNHHELGYKAVFYPQVKIREISFRSYGLDAHRLIPKLYTRKINEY